MAFKIWCINQSLTKDAAILKESWLIHQNLNAIGSYIHVKRKQINIEDIWRFQRTEIQMVRWMYSTSLPGRRPSEEIQDRLGIQDIFVIMRQMQLRWFGHIERMKTEKWVRKCKNLVIDGSAGWERPRKIWNQIVQND